MHISCSILVSSVSISFTLQFHVCHNSENLFTTTILKLCFVILVTMENLKVGVFHIILKILFISANHITIQNLRR